jgi:hypothetical protein
MAATRPVLIANPKLLRRRGRPHMDLQRQHHRTATLVQGPSTPSRQSPRLPLASHPAATGSVGHSSETELAGTLARGYEKLQTLKDRLSKCHQHTVPQPWNMRAPAIAAPFEAKYLEPLLYHQFSQGVFRKMLDMPSFP